MELQILFGCAELAGALLEPQVHERNFNAVYRAFQMTVRPYKSVNLYS